MHFLSHHIQIDDLRLRDPPAGLERCALVRGNSATAFHKEQLGRETQITTGEDNPIGIGILDRIENRRKKPGIIPAQSPGKTEKISNRKSCVFPLKIRSELAETA